MSILRIVKIIAIRAAIIIMSALFWWIDRQLSMAGYPSPISLYVLGGLYGTGAVSTAWMVYRITHLKGELYPLGASIGLGLIWPLGILYYGYWAVIAVLLWFEKIVMEVFSE